MNIFLKLLRSLQALHFRRPGKRRRESVSFDVSVSLSRRIERSKFHQNFIQLHTWDFHFNISTLNNILFKTTKIADTFLQNLLPWLVFAIESVFCENEDTSFIFYVRYEMRLKKQWSIDQYPFKIRVSTFKYSWFQTNSDYDNFRVDCQLSLRYKKMYSVF